MKTQDNTPEPAVHHSWPMAGASTPQSFLVGIDVGSTTVKTIVRAANTQEILYKGYRRHESRQAETVLAALLEAKRELGISDGSTRLFMTGSGGQQIAQLLGARFVQEAAAVIQGQPLI